MTQSDRIFECLKKNNLRQIKLLLEGGCDANITDKSGRSLLMMSLVLIHDPDARRRMVHLLVQKGVQINNTDKNGKCALTYSCVLDQIDDVKTLLRQPGIDPNIPDIHGATPLMHAASLGHLEVIKAMMECDRGGAVTIDIKVRDDNGNNVMDHAKNNKTDYSQTKQQQKEFNTNSRKVQQLLQNYSSANTNGILDCPPNLDNVNSGEAIELKDLKNTINKHQTADFGKSNVVHSSQNTDTAGINNGKTVGDTNVPPETEDSNIRRWATDLKSQYEESGRMSSLLSPSTISMSRAGSRQEHRGLSARQRSHSSLSTSSNYHDKSGIRGEDEDDDFSLESLSDLVGTVRQYAQEIREIYAPIQKEKEERTKKRQEKKTKRKSKTLQKAFVSKVGDARNLATPVIQEVCVEIHKSDDSENEPNRRLSQSRSYEPPSSHPLASLHVENEQLSRTWPRGRQRTKSEDRSRSFKESADRPDHHGSKLSIISAPGPSTSFSRPQVPADWNEKASLEQEREILNNAFKRLNSSTNDPLLKSINENKKSMKLRQQVTNSRQSVIQMGKGHQPASSNEVPSISIIPPPFDHKPFSHPPRHEPFHNDVDMMASRQTGQDNIINIDSTGCSKMPRESKNGGHGVKSSAKGLRRRKSQDQGLGQTPPVFDRY